MEIPSVNVKIHTIVLFLGGNGFQLRYPTGRVVYSYSGFKHLFKKKNTPSFSSFEEKKIYMSPICGSKEKGILFSPFRPFFTDKNGICTLA